MYEVLRLPLAFLLVVEGGLGLHGALLAVIIAHAAMILLVYLSLHRRGLRLEGVDFNLIKRWFKGFSIPLIRAIQRLLTNADSVLLALFSGSEVPVAFMSASYSLRNPVIYGQTMASGLYAKMLVGGGGHDVEEVIRMYLAPTLFVMTTLICLSGSLMSLLNPIYQEAYWIVIITAAFTFINMLISVISPVVSGREDVDLKPTVTVKDYIRSTLFKWRVTGVVLQATSLIIGSSLVFVFYGDVILMASAYPIGWLIGHIVLLPRYYRMAKRVVNFKFPWRDTLAFIAASACSILCYLLLRTYALTVENFWVDLPPLLIHIAIAGVVYFIISYALSPWLRSFLRTARRFMLTSIFKGENHSINSNNP
ncbi:MAG: hypothetical protein DRJ68_05010 [Thermoprotei archaeon]|nr:MAG: hypothetical protein DRJ68_05010 [Thermoprotei archaeon]